MKIKYIGNGHRVSFTPNQVYSAKQLKDGGYAVYDDGEDTYRYGEKFVKENFEIVKT